LGVTTLFSSMTPGYVVIRAAPSIDLRGMAAPVIDSVAELVFKARNGGFLAISY
jgi:hypothetical protein